MYVTLYLTGFNIITS